MSSREKSLFWGGVVCGVVCGAVCGAICVILIGDFLLQSNGNFQSRLIREMDPEIDQKGFGHIPYDEKYNLVIRREERKPPELLITGSSLKYSSGTIAQELTANDEAKIELTIENKGGRAKNVQVTWELESLKDRPEKPMLTDVTEAIHLLERDRSKKYEISVKTKDVKAGIFVFNFYPIHEGSGSSFENSPYEFEISVVPKVDK